MLQKLRERVGREEGFTLIELLVVMLILGVLAAIAIPSFINQREKAQDSDAKAMARTMQTAMETYYTDNQSYATDWAGLVTIEGALNNAPAGKAGGTAPVVTAADGTGTAGATDNYRVAVTSKDDRTFRIARATNGGVTRTCAPVGGGCKDDATPGGDGTW